MPSKVHAAQRGKTLGHKVRKRAGHAPSPTRHAALIDVVEGKREYLRLGKDLPAIRDFMQTEAETFGWQLDDLVASPAEGRLTEPERERRDVLAELVAQSRKRGAKLPALSAVTKGSVATVHRLEARGRALLGLDS